MGARGSSRGSGITAVTGLVPGWCSSGSLWWGCTASPSPVHPWQQHLLFTSAAKAASVLCGAGSGVCTDATSGSFTVETVGNPWLLWGLLKSSVAKAAGALHRAGPWRPWWHLPRGWRQPAPFFVSCRLHTCQLSEPHQWSFLCDQSPLFFLLHRVVIVSYLGSWTLPGMFSFLDSCLTIVFLLGEESWYLLLCYLSDVANISFCLRKKNGKGKIHYKT